jgi:hypothetical protein
MVGVQRGTPPGLEERPDRAHRCGELVVSLTVGHGRVHGGAHETEEHPRVVVLPAPLGPKNADTSGSDLGAEVIDCGDRAVPLREPVEGERHGRAGLIDCAAS